MIKIVLITNIPAPYRVDEFSYMQTQYSDFDIHIVYTNRNEDNRQWIIDENKMINSIILESRVLRVKGKDDDRFIHIPMNIGGVLSELSPDVVIAWEYNPSALQSLIWCKIHKTPLIHLTDGTLYSERNISKIQRLIRKVITKNADACIASSTKAKEKLLSYGVQTRKIFTSFLTVDGSAYTENKCETQSNRILYVGSMIKRKGLDLLFDALQYVESDWQLNIVGNGTEQEKNLLMKQAEFLKIDDKIKWCGFKQGKALVKEYQEASVFVLPTREDCFGLVLLEAMYAGTPIIASKYADGAYDIIEQQKNGLIVDPYNAKEVAEAIDTILQDKNFGECAMAWEETKFSFESVCKGYRDAIAYVLRKMENP